MIPYGEHGTIGVRSVCGDSGGLPNTSLEAAKYTLHRGACCRTDSSTKCVPSILARKVEKASSNDVETNVCAAR